MNKNTLNPQFSLTYYVVTYIKLRSSPVCSYLSQNPKAAMNGTLTFNLSRRRPILYGHGFLITCVSERSSRGIEPLIITNHNIPNDLLLFYHQTKRKPFYFIIERNNQYYEILMYYVSHLYALRMGECIYQGSNLIYLKNNLFDTRQKEGVL